MEPRQSEEIETPVRVVSSASKSCAGKTMPSGWTEFVSVRALPERLSSLAGRVLGLACFAEKCVGLPAVSFPAFTVHMPQRSEGESVELWISRDPVVCGAEGDLRYAQNDELLFGVLQLPDTPAGSVEPLGYEAYTRVLDFAAARGFTHFLRMWNHFPAINRETFGLERYRQFCVGRYKAFAEHEYLFDNDLPAASAVGTPTDDCLTVYFLASRTPGAQVENPRQVSAFHYPAKYGPKSPSFSRAILKELGSEKQLYISGTASIVGHETLHLDDVKGQLLETLRNMDAVLERASNGARALRTLGTDSVFKIYLRDMANFDTVMQGLGGMVGSASVICVQGDICRADLLLEIEAVIRWNED